MWLEWTSVPRATPLLRGLGDEPFGEPLRLRLSEAPVAVGLQQRIGFFEDGEFRVRFYFAFRHAFQVVRNAHDAVRIVTHRFAPTRLLARRVLLRRQRRRLREAQWQSLPVSRQEYWAWNVDRGVCGRLENADAIVL